MTNARKALLGDKPIETAIEQYREAKTSTQKNIQKSFSTTQTNAIAT
nr:hypothetical protein [Chroococcidiopsis sp. SAG 2025]